MPLVIIDFHTMNTDPKYMRRALELARKGTPHAHPNPLVGAVITDPDGNIIGEGYHRRCGEAHAEVNAIASVKDPSMLRTATMYVTLEPCAHYGRTGPCAKLIIDRGIPNVVVATRDPFDKVDGRGIDMLREAGVNVEVGMLGEESRMLNAPFFTAHTLHRPFIILKWAQSTDGFIDVARGEGEPPEKISNALTSIFTHRFRSGVDGILVGSSTVLADDPMLNTRLWPGDSPRPIVLDRRHRVTNEYKIMDRDPLVLADDRPLPEMMAELYRTGFVSILVEGGAETLTSFISEGLWDFARVETGPISLGEFGGVKAPRIIDRDPAKTIEIEGHIVKYFTKSPLIDVKNL